MKCFRILTLFFIIVYASTLNAQSVKDFNVYNYTNDNGLPQNSVKAITLDRDNYMWLATESGLVRYDGKSFRVYCRNNMHELYSSRISHVGLLKAGSVYFTDDNSNIYFRNAEERFVKLGKKSNRDLLINADRGFYDPVTSLGIAGLNYLRGLFISNWTNNLLFFQTTDPATGFVSVNKETIAYVSRKKVVWIDTLRYCNRHVLHSSGILYKRLYYLDSTYQINSLDSLHQKYTIKISGLLPDTEDDKMLPPDYSLLQQDHQLYLLHRNNIYALSYINETELGARLVLRAGNIPNITTFREYPGLRLYALGSNTHGLFILKKKQFTTLSFPETDNIFYAQACYGDSGILTHFGIIMPQSTIRFPFDKIKRQALLKDREGNYWMNRAAESIIRIRPNFSIIREITLKDLYVTCFAEAPDGSIWFITNRNKIGRITDTGIDWLNVKISPGSMFTLLPADKDHFWVGGNRHLFRINVRTAKVIHYNYFRDCDVRSLYQDQQQTLWIGTYGKGYYALKGNQLTKLPLDNKNRLNFVHAILEDKKGNVWMTTNNGMLRTLKSSLEAYIGDPGYPVYYQYYTKEQGFNTNEFNGGCTPSGLEFTDGRISFPSMEGLVQFYPDSLKEAYPVAKIFIDELIVDGKTVPAKHEACLPPSFNRLEVMVSSPYYGNPANQQIEYRMNEFDDVWYPLGAGNTITYNRLPHGSYRLMLRKKSGFGAGDYTTSELRFTVKPFFYQEWYFKLLALVLGILVILLFFRLRYFILIKKQYRLEHKVQQRTRELVYNNRLKEKLTLLIAHDLQSPLHFLTILARHVHKAAQNKDMDSVLEGSEEIKNTTAKIYSFVEEFNLWNMSLNENYRLNKTSFPINTLVEELKQFFMEMMRLKKNALEIESDFTGAVITDRDVLKAILRNIIDNANKYTQDGTITIRVEKDGDNHLMITIRDTGNGMSIQQLEQINYRMGHASSIPGIEKDGRLGFQLIIDFAARLEAQLHIDSSPGKGTAITLSGLTCSG